MSVLAFLAITFGAGAAGLLTRRRPPVSIAVGLLGLVAALVSALLISPGDRLVVGTGALVATDFMQLFVVFGTVASLALCVMALGADVWQRNLPHAMLIGLGALALGLGLDDPVAGLAATAAAGLPGVLVAITTPVDVRGVRSAARELRAVAVTGAFAIVAAALVSGPAGLVNLPPTVVGLAYLAMALAVAVRFGAIPFHTRVARVTGSAPTAALPLLLALAPAGFASAALVWIDGNIATTALPLEAERAVIVVVGLLCILLGILAATIQDDIEHVVGYSVIQDAGFAMLALAIFDPAAWEPARSWLLVYVVTKSAFAGWALAMRAAFGTSRIAELSGWLRRAPLLAVALAGIVAATVSVPGLVVFDARSQLATLALGSPLAILAIAGGLASLLYYGRIAMVGVGPAAPLVAAYPGVRPRGPAWVFEHAAGAEVRTGAPAAAEGGGPTATEAGPADTSAPRTVGHPGRHGTLPIPLGLDGAGDGSTPAAGRDALSADVTGAPPPVPIAPGSAVPGSVAVPVSPPAAPTAPTSPRPGGADALRRDPKELTQAWAREALERAGLAPAVSTTAAPLPPAGSEQSAPLPPATGDGGPASSPGPEHGDGGGGSRAGAASRGARRRVTAAGGGRPAGIAALWAANRLLVVVLLTVGLSGLGLAAAAGGFGVAEAARAQAPQAGGGDLTKPGPEGGEPYGPGDTASPGTSDQPGAPGQPTSIPPDASIVPGGAESAPPAESVGPAGSAVPAESLGPSGSAAPSVAP